MNTDDPKKEQTPEEIDAQLLKYAQSFDATLDIVFPTVLNSNELSSFRHKVANRLQNRIISVAGSIIRLTKIAAKVDPKAIADNSQSILALSRVLIEVCDKFNYLALSPVDDFELKIRTLYFSLVGAVKYKSLNRTVAPDPNNKQEREDSLVRTERLIDKRKADLKSAGIERWLPFIALSPEKQQMVLRGETQEDYLKSDWNTILEKRLDPSERKHYFDLGNAAIHSSAFVVSFFEDPSEHEKFIADVVCLALFNASRHLALCTLEAIERFPEIKTRISSSDFNDLEQIAKGLKQKGCLDSAPKTGNQLQSNNHSMSATTAPLTTADYEVVIGLEVHCQLKTNTKMFCSCKNEFGGPSNSHVCPVCLGMPGVMPVPNEEAIEKTILTGEMLGCQIATRCKFDRKNYFYPDMPKNYQITQYDEPLCLGGAVTLDLLAYPKDAQKEASTQIDKPVRLVRIHLEEDVAKSFHFDDGTSGIDFNRAGTPLMEIVSEADMSTPEEAFAYLSALKQILVYGGVSDADMEKGQMRCDVNVSIRPRGQKEFGTKCELKNLNSVSGVRRALKYEIARQIDVVTSGGTIEQQTRRWDDDKGETTLMRVKEKAHDYRYFPEPDIQAVRTDHGLYDRAKARMPELPAAKKLRLVQAYGISAYQAGVLASDATLSDYFEKAAEPKPANGAAIANFLLNDFLATATGENPLPSLAPHYFNELAELTTSGQINGKQAKDVFAQMFVTGKSPATLVKELGLAQVSDVGALEAFCDQAIAANPKSVADFKAGKQNAVNALKGQVMKLSKGTANPQLVGEILVKKLSQ